MPLVLVLQVPLVLVLQVPLVLGLLVLQALWAPRAYKVYKETQVGLQVRLVQVVQ